MQTVGEDGGNELNSHTLTLANSKSTLMTPRDVYLLLSRKSVISAFSDSGYPVHRNENYQPFFIVGSGRAGTTLLRRLLVDSNTSIAPEVYGTNTVIRSFLKTNYIASWKSICEQTISVLGSRSYCEGQFLSSLLTSVIPKAVDILPNERSLASLINHFHQEYAKFKNGEYCLRWGDKTPVNSYRLSLIAKVFPDASYVHLIRDGVDVISSYEKAGIFSMDEAAKRWLTSIQAVESFKKKQQ